MDRNAVQAGREWIELLMQRRGAAAIVTPETAQLRSAPTLKTLLNLVHLLAPSGGAFC